MKKITLLIVLVNLLIVNKLYSQTKSLKGQIVDENFEAIPNAIIKLNLSNKFFQADDFGMFEIDVDNQEKQIEVIYIGYKTEKISIEKKCYVNVVMINYNYKEFETANEEKTYYKKSKRKVRNAYNKAIKSGLVKKEKSCNP